MKAATQFIEVIKNADGIIHMMTPCPIRLLDWSIHVNSKLNIQTIAVFKIYPKP